MDVFQSIILGLIQGLTEFLPISSSGHLVLLPWFFDWKDPGLSFDVALHFGTLIAVLIYFWKDYWKIIASVLSKTRHSASLQETKNNCPKVFLWWLVIATIPGALVGYFLEKYAETIFRFPLITASALFGAGLILYLADKFASQNKNLEKLGWKKSLIIGLSQAVAIIPGVSRSGSTITAGLFLGLDRVSAARFSFMLSGPIIFGASILQIGDFVQNGLTLANFLGILTAAISGYLAIAGLIKFVSRASYKVFFWYRLGLAILIVGLYFLR